MDTLLRVLQTTETPPTTQGDAVMDWLDQIFPVVTDWGPAVIGFVTLLVIIYFNKRSVFSMESTANHLEEQADSLNDLSSRILTPSFECEVVQANPDNITVKVTNTSGVAYVMRAELLVNDEPLKGRFWNYTTIHDYIHGNPITDESLIQYEPARLYPELPLSGSPEPGGVWATLIRPGETRQFSTSPFPAQQRLSQKWVEENRNSLSAGGFDIGDFEYEMGMDMTASTRLPDFMKVNDIEEVNRIEFRAINPEGLDPFIEEF